jgi:hypothetical protein
MISGFKLTMISGTIAFICVIILLVTLVVLSINTWMQKKYFKNSVTDVVYQVNQTNIQHYNINNSITDYNNALVPSVQKSKMDINKIESNLRHENPRFDSILLADGVRINQVPALNEEWIVVNSTNNKLGNTVVGKAFVGDGASFANIEIGEQKDHTSNPEILNNISNKSLDIHGNPASGEKSVTMVDNVSVRNNVSSKSVNVKDALNTGYIEVKNNAGIMSKHIASQQWYNTFATPQFTNLIGKPVVFRSGPGPNGDTGISIRDIMVEIVEGKYSLVISFTNSNIPRKIIPIASSLKFTIKDISVKPPNINIVYSDGSIQTFKIEALIDDSTFSKFSVGPMDVANTGELRLTGKNGTMSQFNVENGKTYIRGVETVIDTPIETKSVKINGQLCINSTCLTEQQLRTLI